MPSKLLRKMPIVSALAAVVMFSVVGCGVKGDPVPPDKPPELGRGQPTYRRATEKIKLKKYTPADDEEKDEKDQDDE